MNKNINNYITASVATLSMLATAAFADTSVQLTGHIPDLVQQSTAIGHYVSTAPMTFDISLAYHNMDKAKALVAEMSDPSSPSFHQYLKKGQFDEMFGPSQSDIDAVVTYAKASGFTVVSTTGQSLIEVSAPEKTVEKALNVTFKNYQAPDGRVFFAPSAEPSVPESMAQNLVGFVGLDNAAVYHDHLNQISKVKAPHFIKYVPKLHAPREEGSGPGGGFSPTDIQTAYNFAGSGLSGTGQVGAVYELDTYNVKDIARYVETFGLPAIPLTNVLYAGAPTAPGGGTAEVVLDIDLQMALAPGLSKILVYIAPNSQAGAIGNYVAIATADAANSISSSWGLDEADETKTAATTEQTQFIKMQSQGQSLAASAGDSGSDDANSATETATSVDDPASQLYVTGCGGTSLYVVNPGVNEAYSSETTWDSVPGTPTDGAGGGGVSTFWSIPSWQLPAATAAVSAAKVSKTFRNVPDISMAADPSTGYAIWVTDPSEGEGWYIYGGTSCVAPQIAAITDLANQGRKAISKTPIGLLAADLYNYGPGGSSAANYSNDFHDITVGNIGQFAAETGYDDASGLGTPIGTSLLNDLINTQP
jgi:subtilase family serine protease